MSKNELKTAYENLMRKKKIEVHLVHLDKRIKQQERSVRQLLRLVEKEENDINSFDKLSLFSIFQKVLGNKDQELEKRRQEYLMAALQWQGAVKNLKALKYEKTVLQKQLSGLFNADVKFEKAFNKMEKILESSLSPSIKKRLKNIDLQLLNHEGKIKEIREAIKAGKKAEKILIKINQDLSQIKQWGNPYLSQKSNYKIFGKGDKSSYEKKKFINLAKEDAQKANILLEHFEMEILDVYKQFKLDYRNYIKSFSNFLEIFYDNLITDWVVKKNIDNTIHAMENIHDKVKRIHVMLENEVTKTKEYIAEGKAFRKEILVTGDS